MLPGLSGLHGLSNIRHSAPHVLKTGESLCTNGVNGSEDIAWVSRRLQAHRQLSSSDSWGSEEFESYSSNDEDCGGAAGAKDCEANDRSLNASKVSEDSKSSLETAILGASGPG